MKIDHCYVPKYTILSEEEVRAVEARYGPRDKFSKMVAKRDALARFLDLREGDTVRLARASCIGGESVSYRHVIAPSEVM